METMTFRIFLLLILSFSWYEKATAQTLIARQDDRLLMTLAGKPVYQTTKGTLIFTSGMAIDANGSPRAYHPDNIGLDDLKNAGESGKWWAVACNSLGQPIVQTHSDPAPGYYVSTTSLKVAGKDSKDPKAYINAEEIPYFALPKNLSEKSGIKLGDVGVIYNLKTKKIAFGIYADINPEDMIAGGSMKLADELEIGFNPKTGGTVSDIVYIVFAASGNCNPIDKISIREKAEQLFLSWGGLQKIYEYLGKPVPVELNDFAPPAIAANPIKEVLPTPATSKNTVEETDPKKRLPEGNPVMENGEASWSVSASSSTSLEAVQPTLQKLKTKGWKNAYIMKLTVKGKPTYRVMVADFLQKGDAEFALPFVQEIFPSAWILNVKSYCSKLAQKEGYYECEN